MTDERPTPPPAVPDEVAEAFAGYSASTLRAVAGYASTLADYRAGTADDDDPETAPPDEDPPAAEQPDAVPSGEDPPESADPPADVPSRATLTVKEINDNRYYYWQWREGDTVTSKYKGPVDPDE